LQSEILANGTMTASTAAGATAEGLAGKLSKIKVGTEASQVNGTTPSAGTDGAVNAVITPAKADVEVAAAVGGSFLETLTSSDFYKNTRVTFLFFSFLFEKMILF